MVNWYTNLIIGLLLLLPTFCHGGQFINPYQFSAGGGGGGTVSFVGAEVAQANTDSLTVNVHSSTSSGDYLLAVACTDVNQDISWGTGWTQITQVTHSSARTAAAYRIAGASETSYTFTTAASDGFAASIATFSKTAGTWAVGDFSTNPQTATSSSVTSAVDVAANSMLIVTKGNDDARNITTDPTGMTSYQPYQSVSTAKQRSYYQAYASAATGVTKSATWSGTGDVGSIAISLEAQ